MNSFGLRFLIEPEDMANGRENHDTRVMYKHIRIIDDPLRWLTGDWPLFNGFYRPLPALAYEADVRLWGEDFQKYKILNLLVAVACALLVAWLAFELTRAPPLAIGASLLFSSWQTGLIERLPVLLAFHISALLVCAWAFFRLPRKPWQWLLIAALLWYIPYELDPRMLVGDLSNMPFSYRAMGWPPGRTATIFAMFSLVAMASYIRYETTSRGRWLALATLALFGAFGSYEQAVVLPGCLLGCGLYLRSQGFSPRWRAHVFAWLLLAVYVYLHVSTFPVATAYHRSHAAHGLSVALTLLEWVFPATPDLFAAYLTLDTGLGIVAFIVPAVWGGITAAAANAVAYGVLTYRCRLAFLALLCSIGAAAPMAFQKTLQHYYYFPAALRSIYAVLLVCIAWEASREALLKWGDSKSQRENCDLGYSDA